jgi:hypothetical protein
MTSGELAASLRQIDGQRDQGKHPPDFHFRSKPFLHFHNGPDRTNADVRFGGGLEPVTASTPKQREGNHICVAQDTRRGGVEPGAQPGAWNSWAAPARVQAELHSVQAGSGCWRIAWPSCLMLGCDAQPRQLQRALLFSVLYQLYLLCLTLR